MYTLATRTVLRPSRRPSMIDEIESSTGDLQDKEVAQREAARAESGGGSLDRAECQSTLKIHSSQLMQSLKANGATPVGVKDFTHSQMMGTLTALGLGSLDALKATDVRAVFHIVSDYLASVSKNDSTMGRVEWSQACSMPLQLDDWNVPGITGVVSALDIFPPWHRAPRKNPAVHNAAMLIAAS